MAVDNVESAVGAVHKFPFRGLCVGVGLACDGLSLAQRGGVVVGEACRAELVVVARGGVAQRGTAVGLRLGAD